ncbi:MAG: prohibitin family protein [Acidobacteria bacterium]|nr:prohibitin family protein [Acidobacteriota bacterium]
MDRFSPKMIVLVIGIFIFILFFNKLYKTIPAGHVGVVTLFGKVKSESYAEGLHIPVNPLYKWYLYDARQKTHMETAAVPTQDQLQTKVDVSVQYHIDGNLAPKILKETGDMENLQNVHLVPKLRSLLREQGKSIKRAEDFFLEETQTRLQLSLEESLKEYCQDKGLVIQAVLIRDITLPTFISTAIEAKKEREQAVEKQKAELERFRTEQQQLVAAAEAQRKAAEEDAARRRVIADVQAYEIEKIVKATGNSPTYVQLQALETLKIMSKDPAAKIYFIDGQSSTPLPLLHMNEK